MIDVCVGLKEQVDVSKKTDNIDLGKELRQIPRHLPETLSKGKHHIRHGDTMWHVVPSWSSPLAA